uniref:Uncharacterized protein n=1 Tax=Timema cristinae TaxID=61476 RepID=A0A7R9CEJ4_TIMCR|nr:unnamed protein product [Timema cristinae]
MTSLVLTDSSQLTADGFEKLPDQIMHPYAELNDLQKHLLHRRPRPLVQQPLISLQEDTQVNMGGNYVTTLHHHIAHTTLRRHTRHPLFNISEGIRRVTKWDPQSHA